jgi:hypothetical protein
LFIKCLYGENLSLNFIVVVMAQVVGGFGADNQTNAL